MSVADAQEEMCIGAGLSQGNWGEGEVAPREVSAHSFCTFTTTLTVACSSTANSSSLIRAMIGSRSIRAHIKCQASSARTFPLPLSLCPRLSLFLAQSVYQSSVDKYDNVPTESESEFFNHSKSILTSEEMECIHNQRIQRPTFISTQNILTNWPFFEIFDLQSLRSATYVHSSLNAAMHMIGLI